MIILHACQFRSRCGRHLFALCSVRHACITAPGIANGNAFQSGALKIVTTDAAGNFGVADFATGGAAFDPTSINNAITALQGVDTGFNTRITALENAPGGGGFSYITSVGLPAAR